MRFQRMEKRDFGLGVATSIIRAPPSLEPENGANPLCRDDCRDVINTVACKKGGQATYEKYRHPDSDCYRGQRAELDDPDGPAGPRETDRGTSTDADGVVAQHKDRA